MPSLLLGCLGVKNFKCWNFANKLFGLLLEHFGRRLLNVHSLGDEEVQTLCVYFLMDFYWSGWAILPIWRGRRLLRNGCLLLLGTHRKRSLWLWSGLLLRRWWLGTLRGIFTLNAGAFQRLKLSSGHQKLVIELSTSLFQFFCWNIFWKRLSSLRSILGFVLRSGVSLLPHRGRVSFGWLQDRRLRTLRKRY